MDSAPEIASTLTTWLKHLESGSLSSPPRAVLPTPTFHEVPPSADFGMTLAALAALAAEALARDRTLWIVTADDTWLPELSNALDLRLRPLCLVLPGADHAERIALRATLSLLKSRLTRAAEDSSGPAWAAMREHLTCQDDLWRASLAWSTRNLDREPPPAEIARLFPVRIGPLEVAERLVTPADWTMLVQTAQLPTRLRTAWPGSQSTLWVTSYAIPGITALTIVDETLRLRAEIEILGQELAEMELELATAQGELSVFGERYHATIAGRIAELDRLQAELAQIRLMQSPSDAALDASAREAAARAKQSQQENEAYQAHRHDAGSPAFKPSTDLKKRFRQLAQKIHPDRASNESDRAWRTQLMSEANRAYRAGDLAALDEVLALWQEGQSAHSPAIGRDTPTSSAHAALQRQRDAIRRRMTAIAGELDRLYGSRLYELFAATRVASRQGRNLLEEMATQLDRQIEDVKAALATR